MALVTIPDNGLSCDTADSSQHKRSTGAFFSHLAVKPTAELSAAGVSILRETYAHPLRFLLGIASMVQLIACANLASSDVGPNNFARARHGSAASHGRGAMASDPVSAGENLLLSIVWALAGAALAHALVRGLVAYLSTQDNPISLDFELDWRLFAFLLSRSLFTCLLFGLAAALRASGTPLDAVMKAGGYTVTAWRGRMGFRGALVISQVALSLALLFGSLLFAQSRCNPLTSNPGFEARGVGLHSRKYSQVDSILNFIP